MESGYLAAREESLSDLLHFQIEAYAFEIDPTWRPQLTA